MITDYKTYAVKANQFMHDLSFELGYPNEFKRTKTILKSALHSFRDQLTIEESLVFISRLPLFLKVLYMDGWQTKKIKRAGKTSDLSVMEKTCVDILPGRVWNEEPERIVNIILGLLRKNFYEGATKETEYLFKEEFSSRGFRAAAD